MHVTVYFRDALREAIASVHERFPHHDITGFEEIGHRAMLEFLTTQRAWTGPYHDWPAHWEFRIENRDPQAPGPSRASIRIHPLVDLIFAGSQEAIDVQIAFEARPRTIRVAGTDSSALDAYVHYRTNQCQTGDGAARVRRAQDQGACEHLYRLIIEAMIGELSAESDDNLALRKALLLLVCVTQDDASPAAARLNRYLLESFTPLGRHFSQHAHPFYQHHPAGLDLDDHGRLLVVVAEEFVKELLARGAGGRDNA